MNKRILVTGGCGFVGSNLCEKLLKRGNEVLCLDNFTTGSESNIKSLLVIDNFKLIKHDVTLPIGLEVDQIYNLACPASPIHYQRDPIETIKTNVIGMMNMLELARKNNARILQSSTSEVYGDPLIHPQREDYFGNVNPIGVRACYDEGKRLAETLCMEYFRQHNVDVRIIRIFNTYGENMRFDDGRVISNFIIQALKNEDLTIYGDGSQSRSFQYIDDLLSGMTEMMDNPEGFVGPVNLGNPGEFTIKELAEKVLQLIPESKSRIVYRELPQDDPKRRKPDISLAMEKLNWSPKMSLDDGLKKTIEWFRLTNKI